MSAEFESEMNASIGDELATDSALLVSAMGGWFGLVHTSLPTTVFLIGYLATGQIHNAVTAALISGAVLLAVAIFTKRNQQQAFAGLIGLLISAFLAAHSSHGVGFFVIALVQNAVYFLLCLVSLLTKKPLLGYVVEALKGNKANWDTVRVSSHRYATATWIWLLVFGIRLVVTGPLFLLHRIEALAIAKLILGTPLYALALFATYRVIAQHDKVTPEETQ